MIPLLFTFLIQMYNSSRYMRVCCLIGQFCWNCTNHVHSSHSFLDLWWRLFSQDDLLHYVLLTLLGNTLVLCRHTSLFKKGSLSNREIELWQEAFAFLWYELFCSMNIWSSQGSCWTKLKLAKLRLNVSKYTLECIIFCIWGSSAAVSESLSSSQRFPLVKIDSHHQLSFALETIFSFPNVWI